MSTSTRRDHGGLAGIVAQHRGDFRRLKAEEADDAAEPGKQEPEVVLHILKRIASLLEGILCK